MKIDLSKNKKQSNDDEKGAQKKGITTKDQSNQEPSKSRGMEMLEEKLPFVKVLTERFSPKVLGIGLIIFVIIFIALVGRIFGGGEEEILPEEDNAPQEEVVDKGEVEAPKEEPKDKEKPKEEPKEDDTVDEIVIDDVKANLLNPDEAIENPDKAKEVVSGGLKHLASLAESGGAYLPKENKAMRSTDVPIVNDIILAFEAGYKPNMKKSAWTQGSKDFIYQFVIPIESEDAPTGFLSGNYNTKDDDFQVVRLEGVDYSALASPGGEDDENFSQGPSEEDLKKAEEERKNKKK